jgi:hypothetical protein
MECLDASWLTRFTIRKGRSFVLELAPVKASLVHCFASEESLGQLDIDRALIAPVAPGETVLVTATHDLERVLEQAHSSLASDGHALIIDLSDAYDGVRITGDPVAAFARCSAWRLMESPSFQQGLVAELAAKVIRGKGCLFVFVGSHVSHHLQKRLRAACAGLEIRDAPPVEFRLEVDS